MKSVFRLIEQLELAAASRLVSKLERREYPGKTLFRAGMPEGVAPEIVQKLTIHINETYPEAYAFKICPVGMTMVEIHIPRTKDVRERIMKLKRNLSCQPVSTQQQP
jgi:hypothetical protein